MLSWQSITVKQFQEVYRIYANPAIEPFEKATKATCILHGITEAEGDEMTLQAFNELSRQVNEMFNTPIPSKPVKHITIGGRKYYFIYEDISKKAPHKINTYGGNVIGGLHEIAACMVQKKTFGIKRPITGDKIKQTAADMLNARFVDVWHLLQYYTTLYQQAIEGVINILPELLSKQQ